PNVAERGTDYGMPGIELDGNDAIAIHKSAAEAVGRARSGKGPTLLECKTYRTRPHAEGMGDFTYRTRDEVEEWKARCPIRRLRELAIGQGLAEAELNRIDIEVQREVDDAFKRAEASPWPNAADAGTHIYAD